MLEHKDKMTTTSGIVIQTLVVLVWTYILNWTCKLKYGDKIAWFLVFLPLLLLMVLLVVFYHMMDSLDLTKEDLKEFIKDTNEDEFEGYCNSCH
jgi:hypothetical protein